LKNQSEHNPLDLVYILKFILYPVRNADGDGDEKYPQKSAKTLKIGEIRGDDYLFW